MKVGFVGAGFVARDMHARALMSVRGVELSAIVAKDGAEQLANLARSYGIGEPIVYPTIAEMAKRVDAIAMLVPNFVRIEVMQEIVAARQAGAEFKMVICEKPLARNMVEARQMVALAKQAGLLTSYHENQCFMPDLMALRGRLVALEGKAGGFHLVRTAEEHGGPHEPWFWLPKLQGGGVWDDMGCHSVEVAKWLLTPAGKPINFLVPFDITAHTALIKWGREPYVTQLREKWLEERKVEVDYSKNGTPAEDFAFALIRFKNPETGQIVIAMCTDSWMFDKVGLRLSMECLGPGYAGDENTLVSPAMLFIGDQAAAAIAGADIAVEKSQASRGMLTVIGDEPALYGYTNEWRATRDAFVAGRDGNLNFEEGASVVQLLMAGYLSAEEQRTVVLTAAMEAKLETYVPLIQRGRGAEVLFR